MRNPFAFPILVLLLTLSSAVLILSPDDSEKCACCNKKKAEQALSKKERPPKLSFSDFMTKKMAPMDRLEKVSLFPEEGPPVVIPTAAYLNRLESSIQENWPGNNSMMVVQRIKCEQLLGEVRKGYRDITSMLNPVYGRPVFAVDRLRYIRWSERRIMDLLQSLEYETIRLTFEERQSVSF